MIKLFRVLILLGIFLGLGMSCALAANVISFNPQTVELHPASSQNVQVMMDEFPKGLSGFNITISVLDPEIAEITAISSPGWGMLPRNSTIPSSSVWIKIADLDKKVSSGYTDVLLGTITLTGKKAGTTDLSISLPTTMISDDNGSLISSVVDTGKINVSENKFILPVDNESVLPVANFSSNLTEGYAPLSVQFTDQSKDATRWNWNFGDGDTSIEQNPIHSYSSAGSFDVVLLASNINGISSKIVTINVLEERNSSGNSNSSNNGGGSSGGNDNRGSNSSGGSSGRSSSDGSSGGSSSDGSSSGSGGGGGGEGGTGGAGGSPEPQSNVEIKEISQEFITNGSPVKFYFPMNATSVICVSFNSKKTAGKTTAIVEMLKEKSALVSELPAEEVYKFLNIWVGTSGFATPNNIENAVVDFKVAKSWVQDETIDRSSITLNRYSDTEWNALPTNISGEDDEYLHFTAQTPGFSPFAITGKITAKENRTKMQAKPDTRDLKQNGTGANIEYTSEQEQSPNTSGKESTKTPGFEAVVGIVSLLVVFAQKRSKKGN